ncbi:adenine-guanine/8-oxoguanine mispair-specific adenine glycosylase MutY [Syntrophotalea carbinolica DSM 2380]|uniref:Adenine DNA glycosylase n=2 Tax=Syntrophotalea carbinolica TaxID=19 RepID=Q3A7R2_SYNC1|nr:adenine-guanine/8-oxoguanine mispair-specific adenine glycosylase MutY [Syntrophotalea carbinolica DSM 2380]
MPSLPWPADTMNRCLLDWYGRCGRDLPWRRTRDPYRIWLSEIMLQQTGVTAVIPYYERFLAAFPSVAALAAAPLEQVLELWAGLGYYRRARFLHEAACKVVSEHGGQFPETPEAIQALPGIGRSTAGAIVSIAFDRKAPILDGNVRRVLCRLLAISGDPRSSKVEKRLWQCADALTPEDRPHDYAQAIMDLGATVCKPRRPDCQACPLSGLCQAFWQGIQEQLPQRATRKTVPLVQQVAVLIEREGRYLVRRRPLDGMLGGLWEFPSVAVPEGKTAETAARTLLAGEGLSAGLSPVGTVRHAYSHFRVELHVFACRENRAGMVADEEHRWLSPQELADWPLHGSHKKALVLL